MALHSYGILVMAFDSRIAGGVVEKGRGIDGAGRHDLHESAPRPQLYRP